MILLLITASSNTSCSSFSSRSSLTWTGSGFSLELAALLLALIELGGWKTKRYIFYLFNFHQISTWENVFPYNYQQEINDIKTKIFAPRRGIEPRPPAFRPTLTGGDTDHYTIEELLNFKFFLIHGLQFKEISDFSTFLHVFCDIANVFRLLTLL